MVLYKQILCIFVGGALLGSPIKGFASKGSNGTLKISPLILKETEQILRLSKTDLEKARLS